MATVHLTCDCGKMEGWLDIKDEEYKVKCDYCDRIYIIKPDGTIDKSFGLINNLKKILGGK